MMHSCRVASVLTLLLAGFLHAAPAAAPAPAAQEQWIAVIAPTLRETIEPLCDLHRREGMKVVVVDAGPALEAEDPALTLQKEVHQLIRAWAGRSYILLVGQATADAQTDPKVRLPAGQGRVARMKGQPTDSGYGCTGEKLLPDAAVGRFPARTVEEARGMVRKALGRKQPAETESWKYHLTILAGAPSYNPAVDRMAETLAMSTLDRLPPAWTARAIYRNPNSAFNLPDSLIARQARQYLGQGQVFAIYMGHSGADGIWHAPWRPLLSRDGWGNLDFGPGSCVLATFGCNGAQLSGRDGEGYGVYAMRNPEGPAAVIGSHDVCWAAMSMLMSGGLLRSIPDAYTPERLGTIWLGAMKDLAEGPINPLVYRALDSVDGDPNTPQATQRQEHGEMFVLLGDPAMRLPAIAHRLSVEVTGATQPGSSLTIRAQVPAALAGASGTLTMERRPTSQTMGLKPLPPAGAPEYEAAVVANHLAANQLILSERRVKPNGGSVEERLELPATLPWDRLTVRLYLATPQTDGMGVKMIRVSHPQSRPNER